jgi:dihydrofolate reductase
MGHHIIMGRKTYESLGRLLPGRTTIIVTRNPDYQIEGALVTHSLEDALALAKDDEEPFLIGGAALYKTGLDYATEIYLTQVHADFKGDAFLPEFDLSDWEALSNERFTSEKGFDYSYIHYRRKQT